MGIKKIFNNFLYGDNEEQNNYDNNYSDDVDTENFYEGEENETGISAGQMGSGVGITSGSAIEMIVVKPEKLETVTQIADYLVDRKTILLNLEDTNKETARRLIDFLNGVAYAINGDLRKVASNTYVVTPSNVELSGEKLTASQDTAYTKES